MMPRCRVCRCSEFDACVEPDGLPCHWVEPDLCSSCAVATVPNVRGAVLL